VTVKCLNPKCRRPLPGQPLQMNTDNLMEPPKPPAEGDIGICAGCGQIMIFLGMGHAVREPSEEEMRLIKTNKEVMTIRDAILHRLVKEPRR
jgi:hypothetical protein